MNYKKIFLTQYYGSIKAEFWFICFLNLAGGILCQLIPLHGLLIGLITLLLGWKTVVFMNSVSVMPSISSDFDKYSWKYFQSLPLGKKDLVLALVGANFICRLPALVWLLSFLESVVSFFGDSPTVLSLSVYLKCVLAGLPMIAIISVMSIEQVILHPRKKYSKTQAQDLFLMNLRNVIVLGTALLYGVIFLVHGLEISEKSIALFFTVPFAALIFVVHSWFFAPVLLSCLYYLFNKTLNVWRDEKIGYIKNNWNKKRDGALIAVCASLFIIPVYEADFETPSYYSNSPLLKAIHQKDQREVEALLAQGADINQANEKGFTPLMAAAHEGNLEMFRYLETKGARYQGEVKLSSSDYHHGMNIFLMAVDGHNPKLVEHLLQKGYNPNHVNPVQRYDAVHLASKGCKTEVLDLLIKHQADVKTLNKEGLTPIHVAVKNNCFGNVVSLIDAGVDPLIRDRSGKLAVEYGSKSEKHLEIESYLTRRARLPAGK